MWYDTCVSPPPNVVGFELIVGRLSDALGFFADTLGLPVVHRGAAPEANGEIAVLDAGGVALTLFEPSDEGTMVVADRTPRLSQVVFGVSEDGVGLHLDAIVERGVSVHAIDEGRFFVPPDVAEGIVGFRTALTFTSVGDEGELTYGAWSVSDNSGVTASGPAAE